MAAASSRKLPRWAVTLLTTLGGLLLTCGAGWWFLGKGMGSDLRRLSYDLAYGTEATLRHYWPQHRLRGDAPKDLAVIYMSDPAARALRQPPGMFERSIHARLLRRLTEDGARAVFFDVFFDPKSTDRGTAELATAIQANGRTYVAAQFDTVRTENAVTENITGPSIEVRRAAAGWGLVAFRPVDEDNCVRYLYAGTEQRANATYVMASKLGGPLPEKDPVVRAQPRWMNYYGPVGCFSSYEYDQALDLAATPPGTFRDKVVFIGGRYSLGILDLGKDEFAHPLTRWDRVFVPGVEVHATAFANLRRGEWINRLPDGQETLLVLCYGAVLVLLLPRLTPFLASFVALLIALGFAAFAVWLFFAQRTWITWTVPLLVQSPLALGWAISTRYLLVDRRRRQFRKAFSAYISPHLAARLDEAEVTLEPGGTVVETSIIFTDLEGFTTLSEELDDPAKLSELLVHYFTRTTAHVLETDGTIIKYIGDAVFAIWGAPLPDAQHADKAARAACRMLRESSREIDGRLLRTRIGVHTGRVLAGNLGSEQRFDYTCIGDPVNFAARLEGLNKYLGTGILISDETFQRLKGAFVTRPLGRFRVVGKKVPVGIHQLIDEETSPHRPPYLAKFAEGLAAFQAGDLDAATARFTEVTVLRGEPDGPSAFYLKQLKAFRENPPSGPWEGVVDITSK